MVMEFCSGGSVADVKSSPPSHRLPTQAVAPLPDAAAARSEVAQIRERGFNELQIAKVMQGALEVPADPCLHPSST